MKTLDLDAIPAGSTQDRASTVGKIIAAAISDQNRFALECGSLHIETMKRIEAMNAAA